MRDLVYPPVVVAAKLALRLLGQRIDLTGAENVPRHGGVVLALNHLGYLDPVYGGLAADRSRGWCGSCPSASCSSTGGSDR